MDRPLVIVIWDDAWSNADEPITISDAIAKHGPEEIHTIGWLLVDDERGVFLANEYYSNDTYRGQTFIPRGMVRKITPYTLTRKRAPRVRARVSDGVEDAASR